MKGRRGILSKKSAFWVKNVVFVERKEESESNWRGSWGKIRILRKLSEFWVKKSQFSAKQSLFCKYEAYSIWACIWGLKCVCRKEGWKEARVMWRRGVSQLTYSYNKQHFISRYSISYSSFFICIESDMCIVSFMLVHWLLTLHYCLILCFFNTCVLLCYIHFCSIGSSDVPYLKLSEYEDKAFECWL